MGRVCSSSLSVCFGPGCGQGADSPRQNEALHHTASLVGHMIARR